MILIFLIAIFLEAPKSWASEAAMSQWIYEDQGNQKCESAGVEEVDQLQSCFGNKSRMQFKNLDDTAEYLIFHSIAESESNKLSCQAAQAQLVLDSPDLYELSVQRTCSRVPMLQKIWENEKYLKEKIESFEKINDRSIRPIPVQEFNSRAEFIQKLRKNLELFRKLETSLRGTDLLLRSPQIYDFLESNSQGQKKTADHFCSLLRKNGNQLLKSDLKQMKKARDFLTESFSSGKWASDNSLKKTLWKSPSQNEIFQDLSKNERFKKSTLCRLEGRYGQGAQTLDALANIALLGLSVVLGPLVELRVGEFLSGPSGKIGKWVSNSSSAALIGSDIYISVDQTMEACKEKISTLSSPGSCENLDPEELKGLFYDRIEGGNCALASVMGLVSGGLAGVNLRKLAPKQKEQFKISYSEEVTEKELASRIDETRNWMKVNIKETATVSPPRYTQVDPKNEQLYIWHLWETGQTDAAENVEKELLHSLRQSKIEKGNYIGEGVSEAQLVTLEDGRQAVWKPFHAIGANGNHEIAAYVIDRKLKRNRVPLVVEREYQGEKGTLHLYVKSKDPKKLSARPEHIQLFDSLLNNRDRHGGNYFTAGERPIDIDHGSLFSRKEMNKFVDSNAKEISRYRKQRSVVEYLENQIKNIPQEELPKIKAFNKVLEQQKKVERELYLKSVYNISMQISDNQAYELLKKTSESEWRGLLKENLTTRELSVFFKNRQEIIKSVEDAKKTFGSDVFSAGPFSPVIRGMENYPDIKLNESKK